MDFADHVVPVADGGTLVHFLSDQQWSVHWLLYVGPDGKEAVVTTYSAYGFDFSPGESDPYYDIATLSVFDPARTDPTSLSAASHSQSSYIDTGSKTKFGSDFVAAPSPTSSDGTWRTAEAQAMEM